MTTMTIEYSNTLSLLSGMYLCKPTREVIENWRTILSDDISDCLNEIRIALDEVDTESEQELEDLLWDYTRLFIGPYKLPCPPWESVYTSPKRLMMQDAYTEIKQLYEDAGLAMNGPEVMADHIGAELNFLAVLLQGEYANMDADVCATIRQRLLDEHLIKWVPVFAADMEDAADTPFYKGLARATENMIEIIAEHVRQ